MKEIKELVRTEVWKIIETNYEKESYSTAIKDLCIYLNDVVREKTELELDGTALMDKAFMGEKPLLKVNEFNTRTEKDIQQGIGFLTKGLCLSIRNPRSHKIYQDNKETADTIILFINYLLGFINKSEQYNLIDDWLELIGDSNFPRSKEYADTLFESVPKKQRLEILIEIFKQRDVISVDNIQLFTHKLISELNTTEYKSFINFLSKNIITVNIDMLLASLFILFIPEKWNDIEKLPRMRIEDIIIQYFNNYQLVSDEYYSFEYPESRQFIRYSYGYVKYFNNRDIIYHCINAILNMLEEYGEEYEKMVVSDLKDIIFSDDFSLKEENTKLLNQKINKHPDIYCTYMLDKILFEKDKKWIHAFGDNFNRNYLPF